MKKTVLITGATSGIGEEFARSFAKRGYQLILTGRRKERLVELRKELDVPVKIITADLSDEKQLRAFGKMISQIRIDVFINNAGFGVCGRFRETDLDAELSMIKVNDLAMHYLFKIVLKQMEERNKGIILNVASSAGLMPAGPYMATYYATKSYVVSLTRAVARELHEAGSQVYVCALCPGPVDTEFNKTANVEFALPGITAGDCVRLAIAGMQRKKLIIIPEWKLRIAMSAQRFAPANLMVAISSRQQKKKFTQKDQ